MYRMYRDGKKCVNFPPHPKEFGPFGPLLSSLIYEFFENRERKIMRMK